MRKLIALFVLLLTFSTIAFSQIAPNVHLRKFKISHADPQLIYLLLKGSAGFGTGPEISTWDFSSLPSGGNAGFGNGGFGSSSYGGSNRGGGFNSGRSGGPGNGARGG